MLFRDEHEYVLSNILHLSSCLHSLQENVLRPAFGENSLIVQIGFCLPTDKPWEIYEKVGKLLRLSPLTMPPKKLWNIQFINTIFKQIEKAINGYSIKPIFRHIKKDINGYSIMPLNVFLSKFPL